MLADNSQGQPQPQLIELLVRESAVLERPNATLVELELVALAHSPLVQGRLGYQHAQRISNAPHADFHGKVIMSYYFSCKAFLSPPGINRI
jgi:hypothetical protein